MSDRQFVLIRSWHAIRTPTRAFDTYQTVCGRTAVSTDVRDVLPVNRQTCETCLRIVIRRDEQDAERVKFTPESEDDGSTQPEMVP